MQEVFPFKKLIKAGAFASVIISVLAIANIAIVHSLRAEGIIKGIVHHSVLIFAIWTANMFLMVAADKYKGNMTIYFRYFISYLLCLTFVIALRHILFMVSGRHDIEFTLKHNPAVALNSGDIFIGIIMTFALNTIVLTMQDLIVLKDRKAKVELEDAALSLKNAEVVNQQLKQQIHPHFLFNSLNTLKILIGTQPDKAEEYLLLLADFLRHAIDTSMPNTVLLKEEIKLCGTYLEMQHMRFGSALIYDIAVPDSVQDAAYVPPFSLLPLLENAIKHNSLTAEAPLKITIEYRYDHVIVSNNLQPKPTGVVSSGVGLKNLAERYRILSGDDISVVNDGQVFSVSIKLFYDKVGDN